MPQNPNLPTPFDSSAFLQEPFRGLRAMQRQMDRWFNDMLGGNTFGLATSDFLPSTGLGSSFTPTCDVEETENEYVLNFDLPGVKKEDIKIDLRNNILTVSGERKEQQEEKKTKNYRSERFYGSYRRSFTLPASIKPEQIEASYTDGVLCISVPKMEEMKAHPIKIGEGKRGVFGQKAVSHKEEPKAQAH